jgi:transposase
MVGERKTDQAVVKALAGAIAGVGSNTHVDRLVDLISALVPHDLITTVRYSITQRPLQKVGAFVLEIVKRPEGAKGFELLPRRWVVERTFAWLGRCRRLAKDFECTIPFAEAWLLIAHIRLLTRRIARA